MSNIPHSLEECKPFRYTNDRWTQQSVAILNNRLRDVSSSLSQVSGLVVGAGTLPYTLDRMPETIYAVDKHAGIPYELEKRIEWLLEAESWDDYKEKVDEHDKESWYSVNFGLIEYIKATTSSLRGDFSAVQNAAAKLNLRPRVGNVVNLAVGIGGEARREDTPLAFINFTNVARYIRYSGSTRRADVDDVPGRHVLALVLDVLPTSPQAVICDSSDGLNPRLYTPGEYKTAFHPDLVA